MTMNATSEAIVRFEMSEYVNEWILANGGHLYLTCDDRNKGYQSDKNSLTASLTRPNRALTYLTIPYGGIQVHIQRTSDLYSYETVHVWLKKRFFFWKTLSARVMIYKRFSTPN